ncbi:hypothetical protein Rsub_10051 [Raphidocelis subcapitata]|uniref:Uncharacterized protein n=1 Tax=Raphidocelis subcapitata TaxID=307507 RepID=A0A2V0PGZ4_9CHLO|nr:hypothetical protein Rsub_10051 [Raphidocelis subcapitata]|eukprot:GBF97190.1 hypothetical protein Rsub_10051 [Raphidocelis subcapitata]
MADDYKPEYVEIQLIGHAAQKGYQAGSLLGLFAGVPIAAVRKGGLSALSAELVTSAAGYTALGGLGLSLLLYAGKRLNIDREGVTDRVYRLHYNASQQRVDSFTAVGSTAGLAAAAYFLHQGQSGKHPPAIGLVGGAAVGCALGVVAHLLTRPAEQATPNRMLDQLRH